MALSTRTRRLGHAALGALIPLALIPPAASADTEIRSGDTFSVSAHGGSLAWSELGSGITSRLYARVDGRVRRLRTPRSVGLIDVDLGSRGRGRTRAVMSACPRAARCDLYRLDLPNGTARRLRSLSSSRYLEVAPSVWGSTYVFGRIEREQGQIGTSRRGGLFVKSGRRKLRRITSRVPIDTDVRGRRIAFTWWTTAGRSAIYVTTTTSRRLCRVARTGTGHFLRSPVIEGNTLYWLRVTTRTGAARIERTAIPGRSCRRGRVEVSRKALPRPASGEEGGVESIAVDAGSLFYSANGVFAADDPPPFP